MQFRRVKARNPRTGARLGQRVNIWWKTWHSTDMEYPEPSPILFDGQNKVSFCQIFDLNIVFAACFCQSVMKGQLSLHHGLNVPGNMQFILVIKLRTFLCWILWFFLLSLAMLRLVLNRELHWADHFKVPRVESQLFLSHPSYYCGIWEARASANREQWSQMMQPLQLVSFLHLAALIS